MQLSLFVHISTIFSGFMFTRHFYFDQMRQSYHLQCGSIVLIT